MTDKLLGTDEVIHAIELARTRNNRNWMDLLRLAIRVAPEETRAIFTRIQETDKEVAQLAAKLAHPPREPKT